MRRPRKPRLTPERIREILQESAKGADELREKLEQSHLQGISRSMSLVLR